MRNTNLDLHKGKYTMTDRKKCESYEVEQTLKFEWKLAGHNERLTD